MSTSTVIESALVKRVNRELAKDCRQLVGNRPGNRWYDTTGRWYLVDHATNSALDYDVAPATLGRELGVLRDGESVGPARQAVERGRPARWNPRSPT